MKSPRFRTDYDAVVIGAGANGLVAAAVLAREGRRVLVVEQAERAGGKARETEIAPGYRAAPFAVDCGWIPPWVQRELGLRLPPPVDPEISVASAVANGGFLSLSRNTARAADAIRRHSERDAQRWPSFVERVHKLAGFLGALYRLAPPDIDTMSVGELPSLMDLGRRFRALGRRDMTELLRILPMSVHDLLEDEFESAALRAAVGAGGIRDIRQGPRSGGTTFVLLHYLVGATPGSIRSRPWWSDGPTAAADAIHAVASQRGVTVRAGARVRRILVADDAVRGIVLENGDEVSASIVLSTADPVHTLRDLVDPVWLDPEILHAVRNIKLRGCTAFVLYALDRLPSLAGLGDPERAFVGIVSLSPELDAIERAYDAAKYGAISPAPHIELTAPSLRWPASAPAGKHVLVARVQYAPLDLRDGSQWSAESTQARALGDAVSAAIAGRSEGFESSVVARRILTPAEVAERYGLTGGSITHGELTLDQILFMRPIAGWGRYATSIDGLFLGGSGSHPGPGIVGGAGWLAAGRAMREFTS